MNNLAQYVFIFVCIIFFMFLIIQFYKADQFHWIVQFHLNEFHHNMEEY